MKTRDLTDLLLLAALWGASFLFMRVAVPAFGPLPLVEVRVAIAAAFLLALLALRGGLGALHGRARTLLLLGTLNSALPFALLTFATLSVTAGFAAILNALTPAWTALIGWLWLRQPIGRAQAAGLGVGVAGVAVLVWGRSGTTLAGATVPLAPAIAAALLATACYGLSAHIARRQLATLPPLAVAAGSQLAATLLLLGPALATWPTKSPPLAAWLAALALGIGCTALAYLLYFRLIARVGALRTAAVTFLIPVFATAWGGLLLGEALALQTLAGGAVILLGTALTLGLLAGGRAATAASR